MEESREERVCSVEECGKGGKLSRGMCDKHYAAWLAENNPNRCKFEGCGKGVASRGLCSKHYQAWRRESNPQKCRFEECGKGVVARGLCAGHDQQKKAGKKLTPLRELAPTPWNRTDDLKTKLEAARDATEPTEKGCWEWKWRTNGNGYGQVHDPEHGRWQTHRASFHTFVRPIKSSEVIHHRCANRLCWNPEHLQATSATANTAEMLERRMYKRQIMEAELESLTMQEQILRLETFLVERALDADFADWNDEYDDRDPDPAPDLD